MRIHLIFKHSHFFKLRTVWITGLFLFALNIVNAQGPKAHANSVNSLQYSSDGKNFLTTSDDETVKIWDAKSLKLLGTLQLDRPIEFADFCPGDSTILTYSPYAEEILIWNANTFELSLKANVTPFQTKTGRCSHNGQILINMADEIALYDPATDKITKLFENGFICKKAAISHDKKLFLSMGDDTIRLMKFTEKTFTFHIKIPIAGVTRAEFSRDGRYILAYIDDQLLQVYSTENGELVKSVPHTWYGDDGVFSELSPDSKFIYLLDVGKIVLLDIEKNRKKEIKCRGLSSAKFSPNTSYLVTVENQNQTVVIRNILNKKIIGDISGFEGGVTFVNFSEDFRYLITGDQSGAIIFWDIENKKLHASLNDSSSVEPDINTTLIPELRIPITHGFLYEARFSHDGKYAVLGANDGSATLWETTSGNCINTLIGHKSIIIKAVFSSDDKLLATAGWDSRIRLWEVSTGKCLKVFNHNHIINSIAFTKDGTQLLSCSKDNTLKLWSVNTDAECLFTMIGHSGNVNTAVFSKDEKYILSASEDSTVRIWETATGKSLGVFSGHQGKVNGAVFLPGDSTILSFSDDKTIKKWDIYSKKVLLSFNSHTYRVAHLDIFSDSNYVVSSADEKVLLWNYKNGNLIREMKGWHSKVSNLKFSLDGKLVLISEYSNIKTYQTSTGELLNTSWGHKHDIQTLALSLDGKYFLTSSWDETAKIWETKTGQCVKTLKGISSKVRFADYHPSGNKIVAVYSDKMVRIWDTKIGKCIHTFKSGSYPDMALYNPDGRSMSVISHMEVNVWDSLGKNEIYKLPGTGNYNGDIAISKDGKLLLANYGNNSPILWDLETGKQKFTLDGHTDYVRCVAFSFDGKQCATAAADSKVIIWDTETGKQLNTLDCEKYLGSLAFDQKGNLYMNNAGNIHIWSIIENRLLNIIIHHNDHVRTIEFSKDGKRLLTSSRDKTAAIFDLATGTLLRSFKGSIGALNNAKFSPNEKEIMTTSEDCSITIWDAMTGKAKYKLFALDTSDYLAVDGDFRYDGTEKARKTLFYTCGMEPIVLDQIKDLSWEPGLIGKINGYNTEPITAKKISEIKICNYSPEIENLGFNDSNYLFEITPRAGGLGKVYVYVNDKIIKNLDSSELTCEAGKCLLKVTFTEVYPYFVSGGENKVSAKATTREGNITSRGALVINREKTKAIKSPDIYVVSIGISNYKGDNLKLKYASKDAIDFEAAVNRSAQKLLNTDGRNHVHSYVFHTEPGSKNWPSKKAIQQRMDSIMIQAKADDILLIFFGGHGVLQGGEKKNLYLLTSEASAYELNGVESDVAISTEEINLWMQKVKANKQILILDACNSGQMVQNLKSMITKRDVPADQQRALESLTDQTGMFILSASASGQSAYETSIYEQGLLTYSLLSGIKLGTGLRDNKFIDVNKWFTTAGNQVKILATEIGGRQDPQIMGTASFDIGLVDETIVSGIKLAGKKKVFRRSRIIQDAELLNDDLELSALIDQELNNFSIRGVDSPLTFASDNLSPEAFSIRGKYSIRDKMIYANISLFRGQKEKVHQFEINMSVGKEKELVFKIVENVQLFLRKN